MRFVLLLLALLMAVLVPAAHARAADRVLLLSTTLESGDRVVEVERVKQLGLEPEVATPAQWRAKSAAEFSSYRAIVLGDRCGGDVSAAIETADRWGHQVDGNVIVVGSDPSWHRLRGGHRLVEQGISYATDRPGRTGAYLALGCRFDESATGAPVPLLDGLSEEGRFTVRATGCHDDAHVTAGHTALSGITDEILSGWHCSVHVAFASYPNDFAVLAMARGTDGEYTAPDGTRGVPYILARGQGTWYRGRGYVALGDSVAAGEGLAYEFFWSPQDKRWKRLGPRSPAWDTTFTREDCHQHPSAHPRVAATLLGADLTHLACTGASARDGVLGPRQGSGWTAPAQLGFGSDYDDARPDVVSLSLGANDVDFAERVGACYLPRFGGCDTDQSRLDAPLESQRRDLGVVLDEVARRGPGGKAPLTVLTQYADPFPQRWSDECPDLDIPVPFTGLSKREMDFLRAGLERLNSNIRDVAAARGAIALPVPAAFDEHRFCSDVPWTFGPSIRTNSLIGADLRNPAPFHPTIAGQEALARSLAEVVRLKLPVYPGTSVPVRLPNGRLRFAEVTRAGEVAVVPEDVSGGVPPARSFRKVSGFEVVTSAEYRGEVSVSLPASGPLSLFHFEGGRWDEVASQFEDGHVTGEVGSLSPFALGEPVSPLIARIDHSGGGLAPVGVAFDGSGSRVADGSEVVSWRWSFGDGTVGTGPVPMHVYDQSGTYDVRLEVVAANGAVDVAHAEVTVRNAPPVAEAEAPSRVRAGERLVLVSRSTDPNGSVRETAWDFGDGSDPAVGERVEHVFDRPGTYVVRLQVGDDEGEEGSVELPIEVVGEERVAPGGGGPAPGPPDARRARLTIGRRLSWDVRGRLLVPVRCAAAGAACRGRLEVLLARGSRRSARRVSLATGRFALASGRRARLRLRPRRAVRRLRRRPIAVRVVARLSGGRAVAVSARLAGRGRRR